MISFLFKIWGLAKPYRGRLLWGVLTGIIAGFLEPLVIAVFTFVFQLIFSPGNTAFVVDDIKDVPALTVRLRQPPDEVSKYLVSRISPETRQKLSSHPESGSGTNLWRSSLAAELNLIILGPSVYDPARFAGVNLSPETRQALAQPPQPEGIMSLNRLLLQDAWPRELRKGASVRSQVKGVPRFVQDRVPQSVWDWLDSARNALASGAKTHAWAVVLLVAFIPAMIFLRGLFSYLSMYFLQWAAIRTITDLRI
ncbi:MAG: uncharacterized protein JWR69_871, partial [Pedosphaera sp.]|nr:uncharacterized protein [Pedosphaera sp.]